MIKAPKWCGDAVPVKSGWADPRTGEVLKVQNFSASEIAEWKSSKSPAPSPAPVAPVVEDSTEESEE